MASAINRADESTVTSRLEAGERLAVGASAVLLLSLFAFDWFAFSLAGRNVAGSEGDAFRWLNGLDYVLLVVSLVAVAAPLLRLVGLVKVAPRDLAVVTGSAGLIAALVIAYLIMSPPEIDRDSLTVLGGGPDTIARGGILVGLVAAIAVVAASLLTLVASPAAPAPALRPRLAAPAHLDGGLRQQVAAVAPTPETAQPKRAPKPTPSSVPARPRLATATPTDLVAVGFTPTQAERIVSYRDEEALVSRVADLKRVPGIAKPVLAELVKRLDD